MAQYPPAHNQPSQTPMAPRKENGWGLTGFIVSLVGVFLCGIPFIFGVIISAIGLKKKPRGLAVAGIVIGLLGLIECVAFGFASYRAYELAQETMAEIHTVIEVASQLEEAAIEVGHEWDQLKRIPTQPEGQTIVDGKRDRLGNSIVYETDGTSFSLRAAGADGELETEDDSIVGPFSDVKSLKALEAKFDTTEDDWEEEDPKSVN